MESKGLSKKEFPKENIKTIDLPDDVVHQITEKLYQFEESLGFLQKDLTLSTISKTLKSNSKYISKIINHTKNKTFVSYINELRIEYIIDQLKNDPVLRNYTIKAISDKAGFKNAQSFSQAFYKKTGIYPSYFIKNISS